jgi:Predicted integral membrane protein (DUF2269)
MSRLHKLFRFFHLIGLVMFFGSVLGHVVLGVLPGVAGDAHAVLTIRLASSYMTRALTLPGLFVILVSGVWLTLRRFGGFFTLRWLTVHQAFALLIFLNAIFLLTPLGNRLLDMARSAYAGELMTDLMGQLSDREALLGACNLLLTLGVIAVATFKPQFRRGTASKRLPS